MERRAQIHHHVTNLVVSERRRRRLPAGRLSWTGFRGGLRETEAPGGLAGGLGRVLLHSNHDSLDRAQWEFTTGECSDCDAC